MGTHNTLQPSLSGTFPAKRLEGGCRKPLLGVWNKTLSSACVHTPSIGYAIERALFIAVQLSSDTVSALRKVWVLIKLQALLYDILPSTTAVFSYAIGPRKLSANEQVFLLVLKQQYVCYKQLKLYQTFVFITDHVVYASSIKTKIFRNETELLLFFIPGVDASHVCVRAWAQVASTVLSVPKPFGGR